MVSDFGFKHLLGLSWLSILIIVALVLTLHFKKKYAKGVNYDRAVIRYTCYFMWAWEIIKTIRIFNGADYGAVGDYTAYMLPFHICSMALYAYLIIGSKHPGKLSEYVKPFGFATMLLVTMIILIIPASSGILGDQNNWNFIYDNLLPYQSFLYHGSLVFVPLYMILSGFYKPKYKDIIKATVVLLVVACFSFTLNKILGVTDFMMLEFGWGNPFAFLIEKSYWLYLLILASIAIGGTSIVILTTIYIQKLINHFKNKKKINCGNN
jgi:uncharacterized membrane protein YwaF